MIEISSIPNKEGNFRNVYRYLPFSTPAYKINDNYRLQYSGCKRYCNNVKIQKQSVCDEIQ